MACRSAPVQLYEGPRRAPEEAARVHTGEGFWGDKELFLAEVNGISLWDPESFGAQLFEVFVVENDVQVLPGQVDLLAGQGQEVTFQAEAGATYRLSLAPAAHDTIPVLVVTAEFDQRRVVDSEPRVADLSTAAWELPEDWSIVDWLRYRPPHADVEADAITYERRAPSDAGQDWTGLTWMTSIGLSAGPQPGERMALAGDMLLDLELDYRDLVSRVIQDEPRLVRWSGNARDGGRAVSGLVMVHRAGDTLRAISCVGPGPWAAQTGPLETRLLRAMGTSR